MAPAVSGSGEAVFPATALGRQTARGRTILLHAEQGLGDTLQFIRYAPLVQQCGAGTRAVSAHLALFAWELPRD